MKEKNQLYHVTEVIRSYHCGKPLSFFLKTWFQQHRNMGSNDRRTMRAFVYNYFRLGKCVSRLAMEERIALSSFLILNTHHPLGEYCIRNFSLLPAENIFLSQEEKIKIIPAYYPGFNLKEVFPFHHYLSSGMDGENFCKSFLIQPDAWIRTRKGYEKNVLEDFNKNNIEYKEEPGMPCSISVNNSAPLTALKSFEKGYFEIQDLSSQKTAVFFNPGENESWWDCCAGSGGKSLLLAEQAKNLKITASDTRDSILKNLNRRFKKASIKNFEINKIDLKTLNLKPATLNPFDGIIADVPCSGSGTWARTPEMLHCFNEDEIEKFSAIQKQILKTIAPCLEKGKPLVYITCSVFKNENEDVIDYAIKKLDFRLDKSELIKGFEKKADTLYAARLIKN